MVSGVVVVAAAFNAATSWAEFETVTVVLIRLIPVQTLHMGPIALMSMIEIVTK